MKVFVLGLASALSSITPNVQAADAPECESAASVKDMQISPEKLALRSGAFLEFCKKGGGTLVDGANPSLSGRLTLPAKAKWPAPGNGSRGADPKAASGPTILVYIVETDGRVSWLSILQSSGVPALDDMSASFYSRATYREPARLDGHPVRVFMTQSVSIARRDVETTQRL